MIRMWLVVGLVWSGVAAMPVARAGQADEAASLAPFVDDSDAQLEALASTPDTADVAGLEDPTDPELAEIFNADPIDVCTRAPEGAQALAYQASSRLSVYNQGGLFGGGVCWWHSRLQRSALYLATYRADLPRPTRRQGQAIINALAKMSQVVVIPGYADFHEFSRDYEREIIARLEAWQRFDGFLGFRWVDGLAGRWQVPTKTLELIMSRIHELVAVKHQILFEKLHLHRMVGSHALLVIGSRKTQGGYELDAIDSNFPSATFVIRYVPGQTSLYLPYGNEAFVPYLDFRGDSSRIDGALHRFCSTRR